MTRCFSCSNSTWASACSWVVGGAGSWWGRGHPDARGGKKGVRKTKKNVKFLYCPFFGSLNVAKSLQNMKFGNTFIPKKIGSWCPIKKTKDSSCKQKIWTKMSFLNQKENGGGKAKKHGCDFLSFNLSGPSTRHMKLTITG